MSGLLINGVSYPVPGATIVAPNEQPWVTLQGRDHRKRLPTDGVVQQGTCHTTQGHDPQIIKPGSPTYDPIARCRQIADYWRISPRGAATSGGAHVIVCGKLIVQLVDLARFIAYHATKVNDHSFGVEMVQEPDGTVHSDTIDTTVSLFFVACDVLGVPLMTTSRVYRSNEIVERLRYGGADTYGVFGHRDNAWMFPEWFASIYPPAIAAQKLKTWPKGYADRGRGDPGDEWYRRMRARGCIALDFDKREDVALIKRVQINLNTKHGERLLVDGFCGQKTVAALRKHQLWNGGVFVEAPIG